MLSLKLQLFVDQPLAKLFAESSSSRLGIKSRDHLETFGLENSRDHHLKVPPHGAIAIEVWRGVS